MTETRSPIQQVALWTAVVATLPYLLLKLAWLGGSTLGIESEAAAAEMHGPRFVVGNLTTVLLELLATALAITLTQPWGRRLPTWLVLVVAGGATGLLAPILIGLPIGAGLQLLVHGHVATGGEDGLAPWVFAIVYGGFSILALALTVLFGYYVHRRWGALFAAPPRSPSAWATIAGAVGLVPFGAAMLFWGVLGPGSTGPRGMESLEQRVVLVVTGALALAAFAAPLLPTASAKWSQAAWVATWVGCASTALQGPAHLLLADGARPQPIVTVLAVLSTIGSSDYGLAILRARHRELAPLRTSRDRRIAALQSSPSALSRFIEAEQASPEQPSSAGTLDCSLSPATASSE